MRQWNFHKMCLPLGIVTGLILLTWTPFAGTTQAATEPQVYEEEAVVVTATRTEQAEQEAPGNTEVITKEEIAISGAVTVDEALATAGITLSSYGGTSGTATVQLDGANEKQTLVLINGVPVNSGTGGSVDLSYFPTAGIRRIEIAHGPLSALYGANALGGVVNIITDLTGPAAQQVLLTGGSNVYGQLDFTVQQPRFGLAAGGLTNEGFRKHSATNTNYLMGQYDFWQTDHKELRLNFLSNTKDYEIPGSTSKPSQSDSMQKNLALDLSGKNVNGQFTLEYKFYGQLHTLEDEGSNSQTRYQTGIWGVDAAGGHPFGAHQALVGTQLHQSRLSRNETNQTWHNGALYIQDCWQIAPRWQWISGARWDTGSVYSSPLCPRFGLNYAASDELTLKLGYGKAFRAPTFDDLYFPAGASGGYSCKGNPALKPETSERYEITGEWRHGTYWVILNGYTAKVADGIDWKKDTNGVYSPQNVDRMQVNGVSINWRTKLGRYFSTGLQYLRTDKQAWSGATQSYSIDENNLGKNRYIWDLSYLRGAWRTALNANRVTDRNNQQCDYTVIGYHLNYQARPQLGYGLKITNLIDRDYQVVSGYPMPGREYFLSVRYTY